MLVLVALLVIPFLYFSYPLRLSTKSLLHLFLFFHTLCLAYLFLLPQSNVFTALNVPLSTPAGKLRSLLVSLNGGALPDHLDTLVRRLNELEMRALYVRLGHKALTCPFCATESEFMLYALPQTLLAYVLESAILGLVCAAFSPIHGAYTWLHHDPTTLLQKMVNLTPKQVREGMVWVLVAGLAGEVYVTMSVDVVIQPGVKGIMWHDLLAQTRLAVFLFLPLIACTILTFSSNSSSQNEGAGIEAEGEGEGPKNPSVPHLLSLHSHLRFLRLLYPAVLRNEKLGERAVKRMNIEKSVGEYAMREAEVGEWLVQQHAKIQNQNGVREEEEVMEEEEDKKKREVKEALKALRENARKTVEVLSESVGL